MGPIIRILLRYAAGALISIGLVPEDLAHQLVADPEVVDLATQGVNWALLTAGSLLAAGVELVYRYARRHGWTL